MLWSSSVFQKVPSPQNFPFHRQILWNQPPTLSPFSPHPSLVGSSSPTLLGQTLIFFFCHFSFLNHLFLPACFHHMLSNRCPNFNQACTQPLLKWEAERYSEWQQEPGCLRCGISPNSTLVNWVILKVLPHFAYYQPESLQSEKKTNEMSQGCWEF